MSSDFWDGRCESCKYFRATVFKEESPTGLGVWFGYCIIKPSERHGWLSCKRVLNVYHKCEDYEKRKES